MKEVINSTTYARNLDKEGYVSGKNLATINNTVNIISRS